MTTADLPLHSTRKVRSWQEPVLASLLLGLLTVVFFWRQVVGGRALYWGDIGLYFTPMQQFLHDNLRQGRLPLWNPLILCGSPYVGNPQTWPLYPFSILLRWLNGPTFINWTIAAHVWFASLGTYLFLRRAQRLRPPACLLGAFVFAFGGQLVSKEQFPNMVQAASFLPWALWMTHRLVLERRIADAPALGAVLGLQLLAAHAQMTLLTLYLAAAYGVALILRAPLSRPALARLARLAGLSGLVAVGLAAGQLLPTAELYEYAWRQRLPFRIVDRFYLPLNQIGNFVLPTLHGHPLRGDFSARGNFWETCCFVGWVALALSAVGAVAAWRRPAARVGRFWLGAFAVGLLLALGGQTWRGHPESAGLYWIAYEIVPGFRSFHDPARCLLWCAFALAVVAAGGLDALVRAAPANRLRALAALMPALCFIELLSFGRSLYPLADPATLRPRPPLVTALQAAPEFRAHQARFLAPDSARTWQRFTGHRSYRQSEPEYPSLWADTLTPNLMLTYGLPDAYGYEPLARRDTQTIAGTAAQAFRPEAKGLERASAATWAGFLGVRAVAALRVRPPEMTIPGLRPWTSAPTLPPLGRSQDPARVFLSQNTRWQPRARVTTDFVAVADDRAAQARMTEALLRPDSLDLSRTAVLAGPAPFPPTPGPTMAADVVEDTPDRVVVTARTAGPALLILADSRHPGWRVRVDGHAGALRTADGFLRSVVLPRAGAHRVEFSDRPTSFLLGLYVSLVTLAFLVAVASRNLWKML